MPVPVDIQPGALPRERECPFCGHGAHWSRCNDDVIDGVLCPCRCPIPGAP